MSSGTAITTEVALRSAHLAIELEQRLIADPIASGRIGRIAWLDAQPSGKRGLTIHAIDSAQPNIRRPNASGHVGLRNEATARIARPTTATRTHPLVGSRRRVNMARSG
jgi:hypothetical protein